MRNTDPLHQAPRRLNAEMQKVVQAAIDKMIKSKVISPATTSEITSPIVLVKKKNGEWRFCVDYRLLNERLVPNHYPLPVIGDLHDSLRGASIFSTLDFKQGFWQLPIAQ